MLKTSSDDGMRRFQNIKRRHYVNDSQKLSTLSSRTCFGISVLILSEDGGPLTGNAVFISGQRFFRARF